jgi:glycerophosphoryl diester phosphodiesterase
MRSHSPFRHTLRASLLAAACTVSMTGCADLNAPLVDKVLVVGHRGASALRPEHTLEAYRKAVEDGADIIEPDLVSTKDGVLVARHENEISGTTNVADKPEFADRRKTKTIDGAPFTGWFTEDFTLAELKTLRARERIPKDRPGNTAYNDRYEIPTLAEVITLAQELSASTGRTIHLYPETKHPTYFQSVGLPLEDKLVETLRANEFSKSKATVYIQSFEVANLKALRQQLGSSQPNWKLVQLMDARDRKPYDFVTAGDSRTYNDLMTEKGMKEVATYAQGVGPYKLNIINVDGSGNFEKPTDLVRNAHAAGLVVFPYTFRPENAFLPAPLKAEGDNTTHHASGSISEIQKYLATGIDGFFTDDPAVGRQAVDTFKR